MRILTRDANEGMAKITRIGEADGNRHARFDKLRRLFDMYFQVGAHAAGVSQGHSLT